MITRDLQFTIPINVTNKVVYLILVCVGMARKIDWKQPSEPLSDFHCKAIFGTRIQLVPKAVWHIATRRVLPLHL